MQCAIVGFGGGGRGFVVTGYGPGGKIATTLTYASVLYHILNVTFYVENIAGEISRTLFVQCIFSFITRFITTTTLFLGQFTSSLKLGGGGRSAIQRTLGVDAITAGGGGGGADCLKKTGCGGGGRLKS